MTWSQIRSYFNNEIAVVDSDLREHLDAFNIENIPRTLLDRTYHIDIGAGTSTPHQDLHVEDNFTVTLSIWKQGCVNVVPARDILLDKALCLRAQIINPKNVEAYKSANSGDIDVIEPLSMEATEIDETNDNIIQVQLEFNVRLFFGVT